MDKNWEKVHSSNLPHSIELLRTILEEHGINAIILNQQDSTYPVIGEAELYVHRENVVQALQIINKSQL